MIILDLQIQPNTPLSYSIENLDISKRYFEKALQGFLLGKGQLNSLKRPRLTGEFRNGPILARRRIIFYGVAFVDIIGLVPKVILCA